MALRGFLLSGCPVHTIEYLIYYYYYYYCYYYYYYYYSSFDALSARVGLSKVYSRQVRANMDKHQYMSIKQGKLIVNARNHNC